MSGQSSEWWEIAILRFMQSKPEKRFSSGDIRAKVPGLRYRDTGVITTTLSSLTRQGKIEITKDYRKYYFPEPDTSEV